MATNLTLDDGLIDEARALGGHRSRKAAVTAALQEYVQRRRQVQILDSFGQVDFVVDYDYKRQRRRD